MVFFAQFNFTESHDHIGWVPGDILLIFVRSMKSLLIPMLTVPWVDPAQSTSMAFEWYPYPLRAGGLVDVHYVPTSDMVFPRLFLCRYRSVDLLDEVHAVPLFAAVIPPEELPHNEFSRLAILRALCRFPRFKIGGAPFWYHTPEAPPSGRFIGSFGDIGVPPQCPYPFVNSPTPISANESLSGDNSFSFRDGCVVNLYLMPNGSVDWYADFW